MSHMRLEVLATLIACSLLASTASAQSRGSIAGRVADETGGVLPGVTVELRRAEGGDTTPTVTDGTGDYVFENLAPGTYQVFIALINFAPVTRRDVVVQTGVTRVDTVMHLSLSADVTVIAKRTFANLADVENPAENLVGIAQSSSQGAITSRQLEVRPMMRSGEVFETVPGVIITQHSGEGKANQYFLRGFNLDHGSDFAMSVAGTPVNMPTHAHSQGYSDINFLIPELVAGVQFSKGPYFGDQGDFATAGSANINYASSLDKSVAHVSLGAYDFSRLFVAVSPQVRNGHVLAAFEVSNNSGPWAIPDSYKKLNGVLRYSQGDPVNGFVFTFMGYRGKWNATEASPQRAVNQGLIDRFGTIDTTDGGDTYRYSVGGEWQRGSNAKLTKITAYGMGYDLDLISNFTFYLDDPVHGDQVEQVDKRFVTGAKITHRRLSKFAGHNVQNTFGALIRNDDIAEIGLYHTEERVRIETRGKDAALVTSAGGYAQNEVECAPWLRTLGAIRLDGSRYRVDALNPVNSGVTTAAMVSPKGGLTLGPWKSTEIYLNAGTGFHSNNALGTTHQFDTQGNPIDPVTPMVRAKGAEVGVRTVAVPRLQTTVSLWRLGLASELVYNGDLGASEPGPASSRYGVEIANYYSPTKWLVFDGAVSFSRARFSGGDEGGQYVPEAVGTVVSAGASIDGYRRIFAGVRLRYFGSRPLVEDNSVRSDATTLVNLQAGYQIGSRVRVNADLFNLLDAKDSDIAYYFASRLRGEPLEGVEDTHFHPVVPRTLRVSLVVGF